MPDQFKKRCYRGLREFWQDVSYPIHHRDEIRRAMNGDLVSPAFRERLMLAVTAVTGCRYCSYYHTGEALKAGLPDPEIRALLEGTVDDAPADELSALLYAQHWAEADGNPHPETRQQLLDNYGDERVAAIEMLLRLIRTGNLLGNTSDYLMHRLSFGRWKPSESPPAWARKRYP